MCCWENVGKISSNIDMFFFHVCSILWVKMFKCYFVSVFSFSVAVCWSSSRGKPCHTSTPPSSRRSYSPSSSTSSTAQAYCLPQSPRTTLPTRQCSMQLEPRATFSLRALYIFFWWLACLVSSHLESCSVTFAPRNWRALTIHTTSTLPATGPRWWLHPGRLLRLCTARLPLTNPVAKSQSSSATLEQLPSWNDTFARFKKHKTLNKSIKTHSF